MILFICAGAIHIGDQLFTYFLKNVTAIEYVRVFKSLFMTEVNVLYTYDAHQFEALLICMQMLLLS